jgi:hypothetical protein
MIEALSLALVAAGVIAGAAYVLGLRAERRRAAARADAEYRATRERIDDAPMDDSPAAARRWLHDRSQ